MRLNQNMDLNAQENGLCLEDPLEELRNLFRSYWRCITRKDLEEANEIWEKKVLVKLNSISQSCPEISRNSLQTVLFEEKRRLQDHELLVDAIFEKMAHHLNPVSLNPNEAANVHSTGSQTEGSKMTNPPSNDYINDSVRKPDVPEELPVNGLDLTAMIDSMLEGEKLLNR